MKTDVVLDYATPYMDAKKALDALHVAMLERKYQEAENWALEALADAKLTLIAVRNEKEKYAR